MTNVQFTIFINAIITIIELSCCKEEAIKAIKALIKDSNKNDKGD